MNMLEAVKYHAAKEQLLGKRPYVFSATATLHQSAPTDRLETYLNGSFSF